MNQTNTVKRNKKLFEVRETFGLKEIPANILVEGNAEREAFVPPVKPYVFRKEFLSDALGWYTTPGVSEEGLYIVGPTGAGKSSGIVQLAARLNIPVQRVNAHQRMEFAELVGQHTVVNGTMIFMDGPLTTAMRFGHWFVLDEIDLLPPGTNAGLNAVLEGAPLVIPENGGEVIEPHPDFRFIATANTRGNGDRSGAFRGTLLQNAAFLDRFMVMEVDYPSPEQEKLILGKALPGLAEVLVDGMIQVANLVRNAYKGNDTEFGGLEVTMSTRTLLRWARLSVKFAGSSGGSNMAPLTHALDRALGLRAEPETREALHQIVQRVFGDD